MDIVKGLTLKTRIAVATSLLFILFAAVSAYFAINKMQQDLRQTIGSQQYALACTIADSIDEHIERTRASLLAANNRLSPQIATDPLESQRFMDERVTLHSIFDGGLLLFDATTRKIAQSPSPQDQTALPPQIRSCVRRTVSAGQSAVSQPYQNPKGDSLPEIVITAPVKDVTGKVVFVLAGRLKLSGNNIMGRLKDVRLGNLGNMVVLTGDGMIIFHPNQGRVMRMFPEQERTALFVRAIKGFDGSGETVSPTGMGMLSSFRHLKETDWILGINYPLSEAYAVMTATRHYLLGGFAIGTLAVLILTWLVMNRLTRPLVSVTRQVEAMHEGNLHRVEGSGTDEIGMLSAAFNRLVEALQIHQGKIRENGKKYRTVADNTYDWEFWISPQNRIIYSSPSCKRITGYDPADFEENQDILPRIVYPEDRDRFREHSHAVRHRREVSSATFRIMCADGDLRWISHVCQPVYDEDGTYLGIRGSNRDITDQKRAEEKLLEVMQQQQAIIDNIPDMAWLKDAEGKYVAINRQFATICGVTPEEATGKTDCDLWSPELARKYREDDVEVVTLRTRKIFEEEVRDAEGNSYVMETVKSPIFNKRNEIIGVIGIARDITHRKREEVQLRHTSTHDTLTGLYNRTFFEEELERIARSRNFPVSIILGDVNDLKKVNDTHGHSAGDRLLCLAAGAILDAFRAEDLVARIGGDEFAVLLPQTDENAAAEALSRINANLIAINGGDIPFPVTVAFGMATANDGDDLLQTLHVSDERMYDQKAAQKGYTPRKARRTFNPLDTC